MHHGVNWRPVAAWAAVAAALLAVGVGIAQLAPGGSSSSSARPAVAAVQSVEGGRWQQSGGSGASVGRLDEAGVYGPRHEAQKLLANGTTIQPAVELRAAEASLTLDRAQWNAVRGKLAAAAARHPHPHDPVIVRLRPN